MDLYLGNLADRNMSNGKLQKLLHADIISLGEMLSDKHEIPNMQRPFEWQTNSGKKHVPQLWKDLVEFTEDDSEKESKYFSALFFEMLSLFTSPFHNEVFDFSDESFWNKITELSEKYSTDQELRKMNGNRGSKHFLYINRTFFGLYNLLHDLKAKIVVNNYKKYQ